MPPKEELPKAVSASSSGHVAGGTPVTGHLYKSPLSQSLPVDQEPTGHERYPPADALLDLPDEQFSGTELCSNSDLDEGEISDSTDKQDVTEDMNIYRETVC